MPGRHFLPILAVPSHSSLEALGDKVCPLSSATKLYLLRGTVMETSAEEVSSSAAKDGGQSWPLPAASWFGLGWSLLLALQPTSDLFLPKGYECKLLSQLQNCCGLAVTPPQLT